MTAEPVGDALLDPARAALERGDYGRCLTLLQPLAERQLILLTTFMVPFKLVI